MAEEKAMSEQLGDVIDKISEKLGVATEKLTPLAETIVKEFRDAHATLAISFFIASGIMTIVGIEALKRIRKSGIDDFDKNMGSFLCILVCGILVLFFTGCGIDNTVMTFNPHYYLLRELLN